MKLKNWLYNTGRSIKIYHRGVVNNEPRKTGIHKTDHEGNHSN